MPENKNANTDFNPESATPRHRIVCDKLLEAALYDSNMPSPGKFATVLTFARGFATHMREGVRAAINIYKPQEVRFYAGMISIGLGLGLTALAAATALPIAWAVAAPIVVFFSPGALALTFNSLIAAPIAAWREAAEHRHAIQKNESYKNARASVIAKLADRDSGQLPQSGCEIAFNSKAHVEAVPASKLAAQLSSARSPSL